MPKSHHHRQPVWLVLVALILLALIPLAIWQALESREDNTSSSPGDARAHPSSNPRRPLNDRNHRSADPELPPSHQIGDLKSFYLPPSTLVNVSLEEALEALMGEYRQACRQTGEGPIPFQWTIEGASAPITFLNLQGDLLANLKLIAAIAGTELEIEGEQLTFREVHEGDIVSRSWTVPPPFESFLAGSLATTSNPRDHAQLNESLRRLGFLEEGDTASFSPKTSNLTVTSSEKNQLRFDAIVRESARQTPIQTSLQFQGTDEQAIPISVLPGFVGGGILDESFGARFPETQLLIGVEELGFGREIRAVTFQGNVPDAEAIAQFIVAGDVSPLGDQKTRTDTRIIVTRGNLDQPQTISAYDVDGKLQKLSFVSQRLDAAGQVLTVPKNPEE